MHESNPPVPKFIRSAVSPFGWRHVKGVAIIRLLVAIWLAFLATVLVVTGHWWGVLLYLAAAGVGALAYLMPRWKRALDA